MTGTPSAENLNQIIATNLKRLRQSRRLTLDDAAEATGVSKSMLGQIERGECGLSVATLWKISTGLKISFTSLMTEEHPGIEIIDNTAMPPLTNGSPGFRLFPVFPIGIGRDFEILYIELDPGIVSSSNAHEKGTEEFTLVYEGTLDLEVGGKTYVVSAGHSIHYSGDLMHTYANKTDSIVRLCMVIRYTNSAK